MGLLRRWSAVVPAAPERSFHSGPGRRFSISTALGSACRSATVRTLLGWGWLRAFRGLQGQGHAL